MNTYSLLDDDLEWSSYLAKTRRREAKRSTAKTSPHEGLSLSTGRGPTREGPDTPSALEVAIEEFIGQGLIAGPGPVLKQGKEACVYRCPTGGVGTQGAATAASAGDIAVKIYKDIEERSFQAMASYLQGRFAEAGINRRDAMHILSTPSALQAFWVHAEFSVIERLHRAGIPVPCPLAECPTGLAMEFVYEEEGSVLAAPRLKEYRTDRVSARSIKKKLLLAIEEMLNLDIVHGDLSPYNILVREGEPVIIDFPQAVDARFNACARSLLERDILNICRYAPDEDMQPQDEAAAILETLWGQRY